jgi:hypothetical protein
MDGSSGSAVTAALAVASAQGVRCEEPVVLRDAWHVLVHLRPSPIVARVSSGIPFPEGPNPDDVARELHVAGYAARAGAPVVPPTDEVDPGPHRQSGRIVTFWRYVPARGDVDPRAAGRGLRIIHDALLDLGLRLLSHGEPTPTGARPDSRGAASLVANLRGCGVGLGQRQLRPTGGSERRLVVARGLGSRLDRDERVPV